MNNKYLVLDILAEQFKNLDYNAQIDNSVNAWAYCNSIAENKYENLDLIIYYYNKRC